MKAYLIITGTIFGLLAALHLWIAFTEREKVTTDPGQFASVLILGVLSGGLAVWAWRLLRRLLR
jgi:drug/metabolite transporter (DMT)-like permease